MWVNGEKVVAMSLRPDYHVALGLESKKPTKYEVNFKGKDFILERERRASLDTMYNLLLVPPLKTQWKLANIHG